MKVEALLGRKVFVDANAFLYFLGGLCNDLTQEIFRQARLGRIFLLTSVRVVDEVLFKAVLAAARERYGARNPLSYLKKNRDALGKVAGVCDSVFGLLDAAKVEVLPVKRSTLEGVPAIMREYGLLGNDAVSFRLMKERNLKYILTADRDFFGLEGIVPVDPLS